MRRIHGYVLVRETNRGVPHLVVCAYDSEASIRDLIADRPRTNAFTAELMGKLGKRIGSVLTAEDGSFSLDSEDLHFEGVESRPDLILMVFAPEDVLAVKNPVVLPPEQRILYFSNVPRTDAGAEEAFVIRLLQSQIDAFRIPLSLRQSPAEERETTSHRLLSDVQSSQQLRERVRESFKASVKTQHDRNRAIEADAKEKINLSALPPSLREHNLLLKKPEDLELLQKKVVKDGLERLKRHRPGLRLILSKAEIEGLGLKVTKNGKPIGKISTGRLTDHLTSLLGGVNLVRKQDFVPSSISPEMLDTKYVVPKPSAARRLKGRDSHKRER